MDAGDVALVGAVAAVLGAAVGAGGAIASSFVAGRQQTKSQNEHWRRQVRRDAYVAFMVNVSQVITGLVDAKQHFAVGQPPSDALKEAVQHTDNPLTAAQQAASVIVLEGPRTVAKTSGGLVRALHWWRKVLRGATDPDCDDAPDVQLRAAHDAVVRKMGQFSVEAAEALQRLG
ncbi:MULTISPECIES: hypothetical protein [Streptomyces]|uniref:hypothetical protein n=1 Tax=Streptomyces TaxID=1883 RepID=UPI0012909B7A|nr:hypothetical protein [Streptomyces sp. SYP-A7193]QFX86585.1 hypothetical protein GEV49_37360 [Streptomyces sp. SYP-A7193]